MDQALEVHAGGAAVSRTPPLLRPANLGAAGSRLGRPGLLSGLLSWRTSIEWFCGMRLPRIGGGRVLLEADAGTHVPVLLPRARLEGHSSVAASEQAQSIRPAVEQ